MNITFKVESSNVWKASEGLLYTIVYAPNNPASKDLQGDWIARKSLRDCAHTYLESGEVRLNHEQKLTPEQARVVESYILDEDTRVQGRLCKAGTWIAVFKLNDPDLIQAVRDGDLRGVSMHGVAKRNDNGELYECKVSELSLVSKPASGIPFITLKSNADVPFLERPEVIDILRQTASVVEGLKLQAALKEKLEAEAHARAQRPQRVRTRVYDTYEAYENSAAQVRRKNARATFIAECHETAMRNKGKHQSDYGR